jgi:hypothetical protein
MVSRLPCPAGRLLTLCQDRIICSAAVGVSLVFRAVALPVERIALFCRKRTDNPATPTGKALGLALAALGILSGCNTRPYITDQRLDEGLVLVLPGIDGPGPLNACIRRGLLDGGAPYALEIYNWHKYRLGVSYAFAQKASRKRAAEIADRIARYRSEHPGRPVFVIGHSAGGAIAVFTAEAMPPEAPLEGVITLAPALSPEYDLTDAATGCAGRFVNCYAKNDLFLKTLTTIGMNLDGKRGATAGQEGFHLPPDASQQRCAAFEEVTQIEWSPEMSEKGNRGGHRGWTSRRWLADTLAPILADWADASPGLKPLD